MFEKVNEIEDRYCLLESELARPDIVKDQKTYLKYSKEHSHLGPIVKIYRELNNIDEEIASNRSLLNDSDPEMRKLAREELDVLNNKKEELENELRILLLPKDPNDEKNIILEIRAGTGGDEAALFAADLLRSYLKYAEIKRWKTEVLSQSMTGIGGYKEIILLIEGNDVYSRLKYESGVHRVQRVPETEAQGRIHTSAITVAVLPEAEEVDVEINPDDLRVDTYRSSGKGGQHVNKTDSAVRLTHLPTGIVVACQDERSQHKNKAKAMKVLRSKILDAQVTEQHDRISQDRKNMVGTGDRSERIRTYNYPQGRVTDHRIGLTLYKLEDILNGDLELVINPLVNHYQTEALKGES